MPFLLVDEMSTLIDFKGLSSSLNRLERKRRRNDDDDEDDDNDDDDDDDDDVM